MEKFSTLLKNYISDQDMTVYQLSKMSGVDRTVIQNVMAGKKKLPQNRFFDIIDTDCFTVMQIRELNKAYYTEKYGENIIARFDTLTEGFKGQIRDNLKRKVNIAPMDISAGTILLSSQKDILSAIKTILDEGTESFFSNFEFGMDKINRLVYEALTGGRIEKFFHCVQYKNDESSADIVTMFNMIHYAEKGYITYLGDSLRFGDKPLYFLLTDRHLIIFDEKADTGLLTTSDKMGSFLQEKVSKIKSSCTHEVYITQNAIDYMELIGAFYVAQHHDDKIGVSSFDSSICPNYVTAEMISEMATDEIKSIPNITQKLTSHFEICTGKSPIVHTLNTFNSIQRFCDTGIMEQFSSQLAKPMSKKRVAEYLRNMIHDNSTKHLITNPIYFDSSYKFASMHTNARLTIATDSDLGKDEYVGKTTFITNNINLINDTSMYNNYLSTGEMTYSTKASMAIIENKAKALEKE